MKYMTKEWYKTMQKTGFHLLLRVSKKAEVFSEDYFKKLYKRKETEWLDLQKSVFAVKFEKIFPEEFYGDHMEDFPLKGTEYEEAKRAYFEQRERARLIYENRPKIDLEYEKKRFEQFFREKVSHLNESLPESILHKVADIRVLALNVASREVKQAITAYCKQNKKSTFLAMTNYRKQYDKQFKSNAPSFAEEFNLHDCQVISCRKKGKDLVLTLDNSGAFTNISEMRLRNCTIIKQESPLHGAWCLYEEIYKNGEVYEIHMLLQKKQLIDFIVSVDGLEYIYE